MPNLNLVFSIIGSMVVVGISQPSEFDKADRSLLDAARLSHTGGHIMFSDQTIESIKGVPRVTTAIRFWQDVSTQLLGQLAERMAR